MCILYHTRSFAGSILSAPLKHSQEGRLLRLLRLLGASHGSVVHFAHGKRSTWCQWHVCYAGLLSTVEIAWSYEPWRHRRGNCLVADASRLEPEAPRGGISEGRHRKETRRSRLATRQYTLVYTDSERTFARMKVAFGFIQQAQRRRCINRGPQGRLCRPRSEWESVPQVVGTEKCYVYTGY